MAETVLFKQRPSISPTIYVYELIGVDSHKGYVKVGYTERDVKIRIEEQIGATHVPYKILYQESAMRDDGTVFTDHEVHDVLERLGFVKLNSNDEKDNEWYNCTVNDVRASIVELKTGIRNYEKRTATFEMRPEQVRAVNRTIEYFNFAKQEEHERVPKFLWNAKMRFGKTFASYELAKK